MAGSPRLFPLLLLALFGAAIAGEPVAELDQFDVVGKRLRDLQRDVIAAEDRFYERFNQLNTNDDFDIHCEKEKETGTLVAQRQCRIQFMVETGAVDGQNFYRGLNSGVAGSGVNTPIAALQSEWEKRREEYMKTVRDLVEKDPELKALAARWGSLLQQYERARSRKGEDKTGK